MPIAAVLSGPIDFILAFGVLLGMMLFYGIMPSAKTLMLPLFALLAMVAALGVALWLSTLSVEFRDVPALALRDTDRASDQSTVGTVAHDPRHRSDGRRRRGLPEGAIRHRDDAGTDSPRLDACIRHRPQRFNIQSRRPRGSLLCSQKRW
jgi:hypothetical protein